MPVYKIDSQGNGSVDAFDVILTPFAETLSPPREQCHFRTESKRKISYFMQAWHARTGSRTTIATTK